MSMIASLRNRKVVATSVFLGFAVLFIGGCGAKQDHLSVGDGKVAPRFQKLREAKEKVIASRTKLKLKRTSFR